MMTKQKPNDRMQQILAEREQAEQAALIEHRQEIIANAERTLGEKREEAIRRISGLTWRSINGKNGVAISIARAIRRLRAMSPNDDIEHEVAELVAGIPEIVVAAAPNRLTVGQMDIGDPGT